MARPHLVHCSYHKCLTVYYGRVMSALFDTLFPWSGGYRHFNSDLRGFYAGHEGYRVASVNNRVLDLERLGDARLSRFIRDPRDLVVSGYFYHRRGAEAWVTKPAPTEEDWYFANGVVPEGLRRSGSSFAEYLRGLPVEEGLLAELEFRERHFESMAGWPARHPAIRMFRYEEIVAAPLSTFRALFAHYDLPWIQRLPGRFFARRYSLRGRGRGRDPHVRNASPGQWREHFTPRVRAAFDRRWGGLVRDLGYPSS